MNMVDVIRLARIDHAELSSLGYSVPDVDTHTANFVEAFLTTDEAVDRAYIAWKMGEDPEPFRIAIRAAIHGDQDV